MLLPKWNRYTRYEKLITGILLVFLLAYSFFPKVINIDKYTMMLLALLVLIAVMPYISSAKLPYLLEFKKKVSKSKDK